MTIARSRQVDETRSGTYHLISRCVRRAFLCGDQAEHRRRWIFDDLQAYRAAFSIEVLAYAVMSNHFHLVVRTQPQQADQWSDLEVATRWASLFPLTDPKTGEQVPWDTAEIERQSHNRVWVERMRARLCSMSWFMRILKQRIARRANREDQVTGHFWEGRFKSVALLDDAAVVSCMAYVDLNPIRAKMAETPEASDFTSVQERIRSRQDYRKSLALVDSLNTAMTQTDLRMARDRVQRGPEASPWLTPITAVTASSLKLDDYLELVDHTGRLIRQGKRGAIPAHLHPILQRLQIDLDSWLEVMLSHSRFLGNAVGALSRLTKEATEKGLRWLADKTGIHRDRRRQPMTQSAANTG